MNAGASAPSGAPVLSTVLVDAALARANWDECRDITIAHVRKLESELAQLREAASAYVVAVNRMELGGPESAARRLHETELALLGVLP